MSCRSRWFLLPCAALLACRAEVEATDSPPDLPDPPLPELVDAAAFEARLRALETLAVEHGDRLATSEGEAAAMDWARGELEALGWTVEEQTFTWGFPLRTRRNVVATSPFSSPDAIVAVGAHIDTVRGTAGINDNGTGVAGAIGLAEALSARQTPPARQVRVVLFTNEEDSRFGSYVYVHEMGEAERAAHRAFLNIDMIGSSNGYPQVLDGAAFDIAGNAELEDLIGEWIHDEGYRYDTLRGEFFGTSSDHVYFLDIAVPMTWVFAGGDGHKDEDQAEDWGGVAGEPYDVCYHTACDVTDKLDVDLALLLVRATAHALEEVADGHSL